ncbi:MAG: hypothetical protein ABIC40_03910 [bacterium]
MNRLRIKGYHSANRIFHKTVERILKPAQNAEFLFQAANPEQKKELIKLTFPNCTLTSGKPHYSYKKPFDILAEGTEIANWLATWDTFRTWLLSVDRSIFNRRLTAVGA